MKKFYVTLITVLFMAASSVGFAANGRHGAASVGQEGFFDATVVAPRDYGWGGLQDEEDEHNFNEPPTNPGAWSEGKFKANARPSDKK